MNVKTCKLYGIKRKRDLFSLLKTNKNRLKKICNVYSPYVTNQKKKRLIEPISSNELKYIQKNVQRLLNDIEFDENIFSGISGKSYIDNGIWHIKCKYVIALDINKFFPNTSREKVYNFFFNTLNTSPDVAKILTDICTIDLTKIKNLDIKVIEYINDNSIRFLKHIPTGSSISCILSYLVNYQMFFEITNIANEYGCKTSIYVDDIVLSSETKINNQLLIRIMSIIRKNGYKVQKKKLKFYNKNEYKRITGNIISKDGNRLVIPNRISHRILKLKDNKNIENNVKTNKINGYKQVIRQIEDANNSL